MKQEILQILSERYNISPFEESLVGEIIKQIEPDFKIMYAGDISTKTKNELIMIPVRNPAEYTIDTEAWERENYRELTNIEEIIKQQDENLVMKIFSNNENSVIIFSQIFDTNRTDAMSVFWGIVPSLFTYNYSKDQIDFFESIMRNDVAKAIQAGDNIFKEKIRQERKKYVDEHQDFGEAQVKNEAKSNWEKKMSEYQYLLERINYAYQEVEEAAKEYSAIAYNNVTSELKEYLINKDDIRILSMQENRIEFAIETWFDQFDVDIWDTYKDNPNFWSSVMTSYVVNKQDGDDKFTCEEIQLLMNSILCEEPEYVIKGYGRFGIGNNGVNVSNSPVAGIYAIMNPHYKFFNCLGDNIPKINNAIRKKDFVMAIELCSFATRLLNLTEGPQTLTPFITKMLLRAKLPYLKGSDGKLYTARQAVDRLIKINKEKEVENNGDEVRN